MFSSWRSVRSSTRARCALVVNPEITSGHNNFELRDYHFIFGDACTAVVVERCDDARGQETWEILQQVLERALAIDPS